MITYNALPRPELPHLDPFIFLNHHGPQLYPENNHGLPFGPHPHRGMETVTFILDGDIMHTDSDGHNSVIQSGGVQWMTAGKGLIHAEVSSPEFKKSGGKLEILQLWLNLPARLKMTYPNYKGLQENEIKKYPLNEGVQISLISGKLNEYKASFDTLTDVFLSLIHVEKDAQFEMEIDIEHNIFLYVIKGKFDINQRSIEPLHLVKFNQDGTKLQIKCAEPGIILLGHAKPFGETIVARGPFVMNTMEEIHQAYTDYQNGLFGNM